MEKLLLIILGIFSVFCSFSCAEFDPEKDGKLVREVCSLPLPPKTKKEGEREVFRPHAGVLTIHYVHESGCPDVENHFETVLKERGWIKDSKSFLSNPDYIYFRKGDVKITLTCSDIRDMWGIKRFTIDCSK